MSDHISEQHGQPNRNTKLTLTTPHPVKVFLEKSWRKIHVDPTQASQIKVNIKWISLDN